jgi:small membrane protein
MTPIKILLAVPLLALALLFLTRLQNQTFYRLSLIGIALAGVVLVVFPELAAAVAHAAGVGRGVDLVIYIGGVVFFIAMVVLFSKLRQVERTQTEIIRQMTLTQAKPAAGTSRPA